MSDPRLARPLWRGRTNVDALTIACIEHAEQIVRDDAPKIAHEFVVTQGSYQGGHGDQNSAGTHDQGGAVDLHWCGHPACILALRKAGTTASHRTPAQGPWPDHIHLVVIGHPDLAPAAARQVTAYLAGRNGLANNGPDDGPRLDPIPRPVWPWPPEDDMPYLDWPEKDRKALANDVADALLARDVDPDQPRLSVRQALRQGANGPAVAREVGKKVFDALNGTVGSARRPT